MKKYIIDTTGGTFTFSNEEERNKAVFNNREKWLSWDKYLEECFWDRVHDNENIDKIKYIQEKIESEFFEFIFADVLSELGIYNYIEVEE